MMSKLSAQRTGHFGRFHKLAFDAVGDIARQRPCRIRTSARRLLPLHTIRGLGFTLPIRMLLPTSAPFDGLFLYAAVHPFDLPVGPGVVRFGEPMLDVVRLADHVEAHLARPGGVAVAWLVSELDAIAGQDRVDAVGHGFLQVFEELPHRSSICLVDQLGDGELADAVDADEQVEFALGGLDLGTAPADRAAVRNWRLAF